MKPKYLLLISTLSIAAVAVGAVISQGATTPIENAYGEDGQKEYTMVLDAGSNDLFSTVKYGAGTASTATPTGQSSVGFESYVFEDIQGSSEFGSHGTNTFTLCGRRDHFSTMIGNTDPFYSITSVTVNYTYDSDKAMSTLYIYGSDTPITSIPSSGRVSLQYKSGSPMLKNGRYRYFAIVQSGASANADYVYHIGISSIVIEYTC